MQVESHYEVGTVGLRVLDDVNIVVRAPEPVATNTQRPRLDRTNHNATPSHHSGPSTRPKTPL